MKIKFSENFYFLLNEIIDFIAKDKPSAARKFKKDVLFAIRKDLKFPYNFKKSIHFKSDSFRDYVFKGYVISYQVLEEENTVLIFGIIKNKYSY
jgi:plasmid stabilization system protein ParE